VADPAARHVNVDLILSDVSEFIFERFQWLFGSHRGVCFYGHIGSPLCGGLQTKWILLGCGL
jgi:hypothetical protein